MSGTARRPLVIACLAAAALTFGVAASTAQPRSPTHVVAIYAPRGNSVDCARVLPLKRSVATPAVLAGALRALLAGPTTAERKRGYGGWFSPKTALYLERVELERGIAYVDFRNFARLIPNASTSCGSAMLLAQLDRTAKQFPTVKRTVYSFDGSRRAFYEWLQRAAPDDLR